MYKPYGLLIDNQWIASSELEPEVVISAASFSEIGVLANASNADVDRALLSAKTAFESWRLVPAWERAAILSAAASLIIERKASIAKMMSAETGKPTAESEGEIQASAEQFIWCSEEAKRVYGHDIPSRSADTRMKVIFQPVGVCVSLSAWNFPCLLPARKIAAGLAAGCSVIARPASEAPSGCFALAEALLDAGLPPGVLSILTGDAARISERLIASPIVRKVSLTGSVPVGKLILAQAAAGVKRVSMELGGHAPVIVHEDADPVIAAKALATAKYRNCGQVCISPSRFYVHESIYSAFVEEFCNVARSQVVGDGLNRKTTMGPLIRDRSLMSAKALIDDAVECGATLAYGGSRPVLLAMGDDSQPQENVDNGYFLEPTVLTDVPDNAKIMSTEPFSPVAPIASFSDVDEVIARANSLPFGLAGYIFTNDSAKATYTSEQLEVGMVGVNDVLLASAEIPFGGVKESGFGREGGSFALHDYLEIKYIKHKLLDAHSL